MLEWLYACAVTKYQNFSLILHFWYSPFQFLQVFANNYELNPILEILPILCILRLPDGDNPCCARDTASFLKQIQILSVEQINIIDVGSNRISNINIPSS